MNLNHIIIRCKSHLIMGFLLALAIVAVAAMYSPASAESMNGLAVRNPEIEAPAEGNIFVAHYGSYDVLDTEAFLDFINKVRRDACDRRLPDPRTNGKTRLELGDYKELKWSTALEKTAKLRGSECTVIESPNRPNGKSAISDLYGLKVDAEVVSFIYDDESISDELIRTRPDWENQSLANMDEYGIYPELINPDYASVGIGVWKCFYEDADIQSIGVELSKETSESNAPDEAAYGEVYQLVEVSPDNYTIIEHSLSTSNGEGGSISIGETASEYVIAEVKGEKFFNIYSGIDWKSSNPSVASVDKTGAIKALKAGRTTITGTISKDRKVVFSAKDDLLVNNIVRIYGQNRYETSIKAADRLKDILGARNFDSIIVATGNDYPDALAGSYLAKVKHAPIILVNSSTEEDVLNYIEFNLNYGGQVYILGGTAAVSANFEKLVRNDGIAVKRLEGSNRYETNLAILREAGVKKEDLLVCTGDGFADSLSASAVGKPILLVAKSGLSAKQIAYLKSISVKDVYLIGGNGVVSESIGNSLKGYDQNKRCERVAGADRYLTSTAIAERFFGKNATRAVFAYARTFADGLSAGPLAIEQNVPLILTDANGSKTTHDYTSKTKISECFVLGGPLLIPDGTVAWLTNQSSK